MDVAADDEIDGGNTGLEHPAHRRIPGISGKKIQLVATDVAAMAGELIDRLGKIDPMIKEARLDGVKCLTRLNRDMRFAKGAPPYKTNFYVVLNSAGKKSERAFYYLHIDLGNCFAGGGVYNPQPGALRKFRETIESDYPEWERIITVRKFFLLVSILPRF